MDALRGTARTPGANLDPLDQAIEAGDYTIVASYIDGMKPAMAKENATRALVEHPNLKGMVALYGYNAPMCLEALEGAEKLGKIAILRGL